MKNSKEMADSVFKIRDAYLEKQRKRMRRLKKAAYIGSSVCMFALILIGINFTVPGKQQIPTLTVPDSTSYSDASEIETEDTNKVKVTLPTDSISHEVETQKVSDELIETEEHSATEKFQTETNVSQAIESEPTQEDNAAPLNPEEIIPPPDESNGDTGEVEEDSLYDPNGFDKWTLDDIYRSFPIISFEKQYRCQNITITEDMLELAIANITVTGNNPNASDNISADVVVYSFIDSAENEEIAIWFKGRNDYIVYRAEEIE